MVQMPGNLICKVLEDQTRARIKLAAGELRVSEIKSNRIKGLASRVCVCVIQTLSRLRTQIRDRDGEVLKKHCGAGGHGRGCEGHRALPGGKAGLPGSDPGLLLKEGALANLLQARTKRSLHCL